MSNKTYFVIIPTHKGPDIYINPKYVISIKGEDNIKFCYVRIGDTTYNVPLHKNLVASILSTEPTRPDKFVSYKDWDWDDE